MPAQQQEMPAQFWGRHECNKDNNLHNRVTIASLIVVIVVIMQLWTSCTLLQISFSSTTTTTTTSSSSSSYKQYSPTLPYHCPCGLAVLLSCWHFIVIAYSVSSTFNLVVAVVIVEDHHHHYFLPLSAAPPPCEPNHHCLEG
jgi:hypothetical protein